MIYIAKHKYHIILAYALLSTFYDPGRVHNLWSVVVLIYSEYGIKGGSCLAL